MTMRTTSLFAVERSLPRGAGSLERLAGAPAGQLRGVGPRGEYLLSVIFPLIERSYPQNSTERMETLKVLVDSMKTLSGNMEDFLDAFSLERSTEVDHLDSELTVATIHASKGLEFDHVVVCGAGGKQMPHPKSVEPEAMEEERRLMYVAVTRARQQLLMTYPMSGPSIASQRGLGGQSFRGPAAGFCVGRPG